MIVNWRVLLLPALLLGAIPLAAAPPEKPPVSRDPRLVIELFAADPDIVTPTGLDVDHAGRVFAIESNTHFPPEGYDRHPTDRLLVFVDADRDGRAEKPVVFADGFVHAMSVAVRTSFETGRPDSVYVATRRAILLLHDDDGDGQADRRKRIIHLDTPGNYPHDGLAGFAFDAMGWMYFGLGENLGAKYKLIGSDGKTLSGGGEGGNIYRCRLDGSKLKHWSTGFWNPHASCVDAFGRLFSVDNDPDSLPPCRLMHIVAGGDYGYRYRNGRKGFHPFTSWNGEIPGTLPMVAGTGEAPSGIVAYESDGLPAEYIGDLLVTSWGDHRIDRFRLKPRGASFESVAEPLIQGGVNFRPVGLAVAPDGSLFCTDWVLRDYKLHKRGRIWRIRPRQASSSKTVDVATVTAGRPGGELAGLVKSSHLPLRRAAAVALAGTAEGRTRLKRIVADFRQSPRTRVEVLWAMAGVDLKVEDFGFLRPGKDGARVAGGGTEVEVVTIGLIGSPQFPFDPERRSFLNDKSVADTLWVPDPPGGAVPSSPHRARWAAAAMRILLLHDTLTLLTPGDPFLLTSALIRTSRPGLTADHMGVAVATAALRSKTGGPRLEDLKTYTTLASLRYFHTELPPPRLPVGGGDVLLKRLVVQWIAENRRKDLRPHVEKLLQDPKINAGLFRTTLAALDMLDGGDPKKIDETPPTQYVLPLLKDTRRTPAVRSLALQLVNPSDKALDEPLFRELLASDNPLLVREAVRTLGLSSHGFAPELLNSVARDARRDAGLRADAVAGLGRAIKKGTPVAGLTLVSLLAGDDRLLAAEALRSLRPAIVGNAGVRQAVLEVAKRLEQVDAPQAKHRESAAGVALALSSAGLKASSQLQKLAGPRPATVDAWQKAVAKGGDAEVGRRLFFHVTAAECARCHTANGRGRRVGPDLSLIARSRTRKQLLESILEPSREVAPQFVTWTLVTTSGRVLTGVIVYENRDKLTIEDVEGKQTNLDNTDVELRTPQRKSLMPEKLIQRMTVGEVRDLLAFLETLK